MSDRVSIEWQEGGVAHFQLQRPDKLNALDAAMFDSIIESAAQLHGDPSLRAVVLSGAGRAFCAGLDFSAFSSMLESASNTTSQAEAPRGLLSRERENPATRAQQAGWVFRELPVPVIAAVHGVAFGGGLQIALGADLRIVSPDVRMSVREIHWGLIPDMSGTQTLRRLTRLDIAKELTFTGREVQGEEAVSIGLATRVSPNPLEEAFVLAREIAAKSPDAIRVGKALLNQAGVVSEAEGLALEAHSQVKLLGKGNQLEAVRANLEKRDPNFADPKVG